jgi:hypothetical protein
MPFRSSPSLHARNIADAALFNARPAMLGKPESAPEPGVIIRHGKYIRVVMPVTEALRFANEIADAINSHGAKAGE